MNLNKTLNLTESTLFDYLKYIEKYDNQWDDYEKNVSRETLGALTVLANQLKEFLDTSKFDLNKKEFKEYHDTYIPKIEFFCNEIKNSIKEYID